LLCYVMQNHLSRSKRLVPGNPSLLSHTQDHSTYFSSSFHRKVTAIQNLN
jgi:hypothetical protein